MKSFHRRRATKNAVARIMPNEKKFEFKVFTVFQSHTAPAIEEILNSAGAAGFHVAAYLSNVIVLQREVPEVAK